MSGGVSGCPYFGGGAWRLVGGGQECCQACYKARDGPTAGKHLAVNTTGADAEKLAPVLAPRLCP